MKQDEATLTENGALSRRDFLKLGGTGLVVFFTVGPLDAFQQAPQPYTEAPPSTPTDFNAFLQIRPDGRVTCMVGRVELGQGLQTAAAQLVAEELDFPFDSIDMVMGDTDVCPWDVGTFGSQSMRVMGAILRAATAEARAVLLQMAAEKFNAPVERLQVSDGVITDRANLCPVRQRSSERRAGRALSQVRGAAGSSCGWAYRTDGTGGLGWGS